MFGKRGDGVKGEDAYRALLPLEGRPIFLYVLKALDHVRSVNQIVIIGPQKRIMTAIERSLPDALFEKKIVVLNEKAHLFENVRQVYEGSSDQTEQTDLSVLRQLDPPALFLPAEIPLVTTQEVETFLTDSDLSEYTSCHGVAGEETLGLFHPQGEKPGFSLKGLPVEGEAYRMTHLHLVRPNQQEAVEMIQKIYNDCNGLPSGNMTCSLSRLIDYSASEMTGPEKPAEIKTRFNLVEITPGGGAVRVEDDESCRTMEMRFKEWQSSLMNRKEDDGKTAICPLSGHICKDG